MARIINGLKRSGYKLTEQRKLMLEKILLQGKPFTAKQMYSWLDKKIDLSTVYRTLGLFNRVGILFEENIQGQRYFYFSSKHHHHIKCKSCGKTECVPCIIDFDRITNFKDIEHELTLTGICEDCK